MSGLSGGQTEGHLSPHWLAQRIQMANASSLAFGVFPCCGCVWTFLVSWGAVSTIVLWYCVMTSSYFLYVVAGWRILHTVGDLFQILIC